MDSPRHLLQLGFFRLRCALGSASPLLGLVWRPKPVSHLSHRPTFAR